eukprot:gnl/TRDRNA2_/TRDRNA2_136126_c2_seq1.p1 gnl/TRDRNA2_/TRDRNA2_136126_c2~~gnl/TRDRNA2_/TRDRNA2_136126_c2_seq1.p1  ORF type:complete len:458 (-),score=52.53 gnl/TRDRNA2_/TRDRNA2_136126_c2_seq1:178-1434(-)
MSSLPSDAKASIPPPPIPMLVHPSTWSERELKDLIRVSIATLEKRTEKDGDYGHWIEYFPGTSAIVIACPHDGTRVPRRVAKRTFGVTVRDTGAKGVAAAIALELLRRGTARPHLLVCHLTRTRLDVNRDRATAANDSSARMAWDRYHELLTQARAHASVAAPHGHALFIDVHAQANWKYTGQDLLELGTLCPTAAELYMGPDYFEGLAAKWLSDAKAEVEAWGGQLEDRVAAQLMGVFTMPRLAATVIACGGSFAGLLCGPGSLGHLLGQHGFKAIPSPAHPVPPPPTTSARHPEAAADLGPDKSHFFCGASSFTLKTSHTDLDSVQAECPVRLTRKPSQWKPFAKALVASFEEFWQLHLGLELCPTVFPSADELLAALGQEELDPTPENGDGVADDPQGRRKGKWQDLLRKRMTPS